MSERKQRNITLDALKCIAIIAVVLYHFGGNIAPYGYLGVDVFFVVGGYFLISSILGQEKNGTFNYWSFIFRKIVRLWPIILLCIAVSMGMGFFLMLPDDYENLAESAIASSFFANNILQLLTVKNYWDVANIYKPLMHLWYIGVLMQAYIIIPLVCKLCIIVAKEKKKGILSAVVLISILSFVLFITPIFDPACKFYLLPFRLFEITAGGVIVFLDKETAYLNNKFLLYLSGIILIILLFARTELISGSFMLIVCAFVTMIFIYLSRKMRYTRREEKVLAALGTVGKRSYSIYLWHQLIIAFLFYSLFEEQSLASFFVFIMITVIISFVSYRYGEQKLNVVVKSKRREAVIIIASVISAFIISGLSLVIYLNAGVIRDVPELGIQKEEVHRNMHSEYCDRPYSWDREFLVSDKTKVLVIGNSFARDWANILYEWDKDKELDITYFFFKYGSLSTISDRLEQADYIFFALGPETDREMPEEVSNNIPADKLYLIGNKKYGVSNGIIYSHRNSTDYFKQTVYIGEEYLVQNELYTKKYGEHYVDMISPVLVSTNQVRVFTDDNKFISQDCSHLTYAGAQYYSRILNITRIFSDL